MPELAVVVEVDGKVVGAAFALPDYNPRIRQINGRLFPFGFFHLLRRKNQIKRLRMISTNVLPEYQRLGLGLVLMSGIVPKVLEWGVEEVEFSWVLESNQLSRGSLEKGGAKLTKTYRMYDLDEEPPPQGWRPKTACLLRRGPDAERAAGGSAGADPPRHAPLPPRSLRDLRRGSAMEAAAVGRGEGVSRPPQASLL